MKNKTLIILTLAVMLFFAVASPIIEILGSTGVIENRLISKNLFVTETYYDDDVPLSSVLNSIEDVKTGIKNIYANCIPFYAAIVNSVQSAELALLNFSDAKLTQILYPEPDDTGAADTLSGAVQEEEITETVSPETEENTENTETDTTAPEEEKPSVKYTATRLSNGRPNIFRIEPIKVLERVEGANEQALEKLMQKQLKQLDELYNLYPELNYYVYMCTRLQETEMYDDMIKLPKSTNSYLHAFMDQLNPGYKFDYLRMDTPEDRILKQYRTDHHWTTFGAYEGYQQIINMMVEDTPSIGKPVEYEIVKIEGARWFGSMTPSGFTDQGYLDDFYVFNMTDFPKFTGSGYNLQKIYQFYVEGRYTKDTFNHNYYSAYFPIHQQFHFENDTGRNLLLIGDSYSKAISPLIAAHFDNTYCYSQPHLTDHEKYDYRSIIEDNEITDVLILYYSSRLLFGYDSTDIDNFLDSIK